MLAGHGDEPNAFLNSGWLVFIDGIVSQGRTGCAASFALELWVHVPAVHVADAWSATPAHGLCNNGHLAVRLSSKSVRQES